MKVTALLTCALGIQYVHAQLSLYIPGFDPQPLSVSELGAGSDGRTTWEIQPGQATAGTYVDFIGTATLVEGPSDAVLSYTQLTESCSFSGSLAICGDGTTMFTTETIQPFAVAGSAGVVTASPSAPATAPATASAHASTQSGSRSSGASNPTHTANNGSARVSAGYAAIQSAIGVLFCRYIVNRFHTI